jgi:hypothetical protein
MREVLSEFMRTYAAKPPARKKPGKVNYNERIRRRKAVEAIVIQLQAICNAEETYKENIPENLRNSSRYTAAEQAVETLEGAIELLEGAFS